VASRHAVAATHCTADGADNLADGNLAAEMIACLLRSQRWLQAESLATEVPIVTAKGH